MAAGHVRHVSEVICLGFVSAMFDCSGTAHSSDATGAACPRQARQGDPMCTTERGASQCRAPACLIWSTNAWKPRSDEPPPPRTAARAFFFQPAARRAIAAALGPPIAYSARSRRASHVSGVGARTPTRCTVSILIHRISIVLDAKRD